MRGNYALGLTVGITNMFAKGSKAIQLEYKKLDSVTKKLQKTMRDIADFKEASDSLEKLGQSSDATTSDIKRQERALNRLTKVLKDSGVNTHDLTNEQKKLEQQLKQTESAAQRLNKLDVSMEAVVGAGAGGGGIATALLAAGRDMNKQEAVVAAQTGMELADVKSSRNARLEIQKETGADSAMVMSNWTQALQSGFKDNDALEVAKSASELGKIASQWDHQEIAGSLMRIMKTYDMSAAESADMLLKIYQKSGDDKNDILSTFMEYTSLFSGKGLSLEALSAQFVAGKLAGVWNYDKIADANKEVFQARMTDPTEFAKLIGNGKQSGLIDDNITDDKTALELKNALYALREGILKKENIDGRYATLMMRISDLYNSSDPNSVGAAKIVAEGVGGTIYSEDIGEKGLAAMAKAVADPKAVLGQVDGTVEKAMNVLITPSEKLMNSLNISAQAASTSAAALEYLAADPINAVSNAFFGLADKMNGNVGIASAVSIGAIATGAVGGKFVMDKVSDKLSGLISGASKADEKIGKVKAPTERTGGLVSKIKDTLKPTKATSNKSDKSRGKLKRFVSGASKADEKIGKIKTPTERTEGLASKIKDTLNPVKSISSKPGWLSRVADGASTSKLASAGKFVKPLAMIATGASLASSVADGNYREATALGGNLAGGMAGMQLGATVGVLGGPIGMAIGGAAGGIIGSIVGEEVMGSLYDYFARDDAKKQDEQIDKATDVAASLNKSEQIKSTESAVQSPIAVSISAPITIESGAVVPDDFENQMMSALRNATPELILQLRQTMNETLTE